MRKTRYKYKGQRASHGEYVVALWLEEHNIRFIREQILAKCLSDKGNPLRVDFYLPDYNLVIEFQGQHHFKPVNNYRRAARVHEQTKVHDQRKRDYFAQNDIKLFEICYNDMNNIDIVLQEYFSNVEPL